MSELAFFDTNVLLYMFDRRDPVKRRMAAEAFRRHFNSRTLVVSTQVVQEFYVAATRKLSLPPAKARELISDLCKMRVFAVDSTCILRAADLTPRFKLSFWDGLILAAAEASGANVLLTEDFDHGRRYGEIRVSNPFLTN
jgi:predicted nucleic acid-binding protein